MVDIGFLGEGVLGLFEVEDAWGHTGGGVTGFGLEDPFALMFDGFDPGGDEAGGAVGKFPFVPPGVFEGEGTAEFDCIDVEAVEQVIVDDSELLDDIVDADGALGEAEVISEVGVGEGADS
ncbi:MAG: hypothetical protein RI897_3142 [Verrucomicrobiota bacterium]